MTNTGLTAAKKRCMVHFFYKYVLSLPSLPNTFKLPIGHKAMKQLASKPFMMSKNCCFKQSKLVKAIFGTKIILCGHGAERKDEFIALSIQYFDSKKVANVEVNQGDFFNIFSYLFLLVENPSKSNMGLRDQLV